jgi:hypothetical protein
MLEKETIVVCPDANPETIDGIPYFEILLQDMKKLE